MKKIFLVIVLLFLGGCSLLKSEKADVKAPADFSFKYEWQKGTVAPPYHYEYVIRVDNQGNGSLEYRPDYEGVNTPLWTEDFSVSKEKMAELYKEMADVGVFDDDWEELKELRVGGDYDWVEVSADGQGFSISGTLVDEDKGKVRPLYSTIKALVDEAIWDKMANRRQDYINQYIEKYGSSDYY